MIIDVLKSILGDYEIQGGVNYLFTDPVTPHRKKKLTVNIETGEWRSWITDDLKGKTFFSLVKRFSNNPTFLRIAQDASGHEYTSKSHIHDKVEVLHIPPDYKPLDYLHPYLKERGISYMKMLELNIYYSEDSNYLLFPSYDNNGKLTIYTRRFAGESEYNHILPKGFKSKSLGNEWLIRWDKDITLVEGPIDSAKVYNSIPMFGKSLYKYVLNKLKINNVERINVFLDEDAREDSRKIVNILLKEGFIIKEITHSEDPGSNTLKENTILINASDIIKDDLDYLLKNF